MDTEWQNQFCSDICSLIKNLCVLDNNKARDQARDLIEVWDLIQVRDPKNYVQQTEQSSGLLSKLARFDV